MYLHGAHDGLHTRELRVRFALGRMGATVVAGASTTLGAGVVLCFCQLEVFLKIGIMIVLTISYALLYSLIFFPALLILIGPVGSGGDIPTLYKALRREIILAAFKYDPDSRDP